MQFYRFYTKIQNSNAVADWGGNKTTLSYPDLTELLAGREEIILNLVGTSIQIPLKTVAFIAGK